jgi:hypothetical protein
MSRFLMNNGTTDLAVGVLQQASTKPMLVLHCLKRSAAYLSASESIVAFQVIIGPSDLGGKRFCFRLQTNFKLESDFFC